MKIYSGMTYYCPSYEEGEPAGRVITARQWSKRQAKRKATKKARRGQR